MAEDCISRQAAIDAIHEDADWLAAQGSDWQTERMERDKSILQSLPSAQPERKKGKWLPENRTIDAFWVCSSCGFPSEAHAANILYNFCPHCGTDMRGDQNDQSK
jgi:rubrerythrin